MTAAIKGANKRQAMNLLYEIQGGQCSLCGSPMRHPVEMREMGQMLRPDAPSLDHLKPRSRNGCNRLENMLLAHKACNEARGTKKLPPLSVKMQGWVRAFVAERARLRKERLEQEAAESRQRAQA